MEGKNLVLLLPDKKAEQIKIRSFSWWVNKYKLELDPYDNDDIKKITYRSKDEDAEEKTIAIEKAVYVKIGGSEDKVVDTPSRIHTILTDVENFSRAKYDLRKNTHLFGKIFPYWETQTVAEAKAINNSVADGDFQIGSGYAGTAKMSLLEPTGQATMAIKEDILISLKCISMTTGIPIHWLAWPEVMSNRATAENLLEMVKAGTVKERLIWQEAIREIIDRAMITAIDNGFANNKIIDDYQVRLPLISIATLKALQETWIPLEQGNYISKKTVRNQIPGIDPLEESELLEQEKEKAIDESPFQNGMAEKLIEQEKQENNG
jgi:hypothetical protein